jgi:hypothetical protein
MKINLFYAAIALIGAGIYFSATYQTPAPAIPPTATLAPPSNLAGASTQTTVTLTWTASTGGVTPITYRISRNGVIKGSATSTTFIDTEPLPGSTYSYVIVAIDSATPVMTADIMPQALDQPAKSRAIITGTTSSKTRPFTNVDGSRFLLSPQKAPHGKFSTLTTQGTLL